MHGRLDNSNDYTIVHQDDLLRTIRMLLLTRAREFGILSATISQH